MSYKLKTERVDENHPITQLVKKCMKACADADINGVDFVSVLLNMAAVGFPMPVPESVADKIVSAMRDVLLQDSSKVLGDAASPETSNDLEATKAQWDAFLKKVG